MSFHGNWANLTPHSDLIKPGIPLTRLSFSAGGAECHIWSLLQNVSPATFTGDTMTSFSLGTMSYIFLCPQASLLEQGGAIQEGLSSFLLWGRHESFSHPQAPACCIMRHIAINKYSQTWCKIILRQMSKHIIAIHCLLLKLFIKFNEILTYEGRGRRKRTAT